MSEDTTDWRQLREFAGVDIMQSFVLSWLCEDGSLIIDLDLYLTVEHAFYEKPRPAEKACFRPAYLEFPECKSVSAENSAGQDTPVEAVGDISTGRIFGLRRTGQGKYEIRGDFGTVTVASGRPLLRLRELSF